MHLRIIALLLLGILGYINVTSAQAIQLESVKGTGSNIYTIYPDMEGRIWVGSNKGLHLLGQNGHTHINPVSKNLQLNNDHVQALLQINDTLWVGTRKGLHALDLSHQTTTLYTTDTGIFHLSHDEIRKLDTLSTGEMIVGTYGGGINIIHKHRKKITHIPLEWPNVNDLTVDWQDNIWAGLEEGGLVRIEFPSLEITKFRIPKHDNYTVGAVIETLSKDIIVGAWGQGLFKIEKDRLIPILDANGKFNPCVVRRISQSNQRFVAATLDGLMTLESDQGQLFTKPLDFQIDHQPTFWALLTDHSNRIWTGTLREGLYLYDPSRHKFQPTHRELWKYAIPKDQIPRELSIQGFSDMVTDMHGQHWFCTKNGIVRSSSKYSINGRIRSSQIGIEGMAQGGVYSCTLAPNGDLFFGGWSTGLVHVPKNRQEGLLNDFQPKCFGQQHGLNDPVIWQTLWHDSTLWLSTKYGLETFNSELETIKGVFPYPIRLNLIADNEHLYAWEDHAVFQWINKQWERILTVDGERFITLATHQEKLWIGTDQGILVFHPESKEIVNYRSDDGLNAGPVSQIWFDQQNEVYVKQGEKWFESNTERLAVTRSNPLAPVLSRLKYGDTHMSNLHFHPTPALVELSHDHPIITIALTSNDLVLDPSGVIEFKWKDESDWRIVEDGAIITFEHLPSGLGELHARTRNGDDKVSNIRTVSIFDIARPWWSHPLFYTALITLTGLLVFLLTRYQFISKQKAQEIAFQNQSNLQAQQEINSKLEFIGQLSHDLKTPLTLIKGPLQLLSNQLTQPQQKQKLTQALVHTQDLEQLLDELLLWQQIQHQQEELNLRATDLKSWFNMVIQRFEAMAQQKQIELIKTITTDSSTAEIDAQKLHRALSNLIQNALKFTPSGGKVAIQLAFKNEQILIDTLDSGVGITQEQAQQIFEPFTSFNPENLNPNGNGLGLFMVKQIAQLHGGDLQLIPSEKGAHFQLSVRAKALGSAHFVSDSASAKTLRVLVVEDHAEIRNLMLEAIGNQFNTHCKSSAEHALEWAKVEIPDLILTDISLDGKDGLWLCQAVKSEWLTNHIPVLVVTANEQQRIKALERKADGFITKPFDPKELLLTIQNLIALSSSNQRKRLNQEDSQEEIDSTDPNEIWLNEVLDYIDDQLESPTLSVATLAKHFTMHRSQLSRKVSGLTQLSPNELIRRRRLEKGRSLLRTGKFTVSEVAYQVGFNQPGYFSTCYKELYGVSPAEDLG